jgi:hypothetical protein
MEVTYSALHSVIALRLFAPTVTGFEVLSQALKANFSSPVLWTTYVHSFYIL